MACGQMGHHVEEHYHCKSSWHHLATLGQGYKCSPDEWQHGRMVQNSQSKERMSSVTHLLQNFIEQIMSDALEEHDGKVSISSKNISVCILPMTKML